MTLNGLPSSTVTRVGKGRRPVARWENSDGGFSVCKLQAYCTVVNFPSSGFFSRLSTVAELLFLFF